MNAGNDTMADCSQIWKFPLGDQVTVIKAPKGAIIRHLALQILPGENACPTLWLEVQPNAPIESRVFRLFDTGQAIPYKPLHRTYIGTVGSPITYEAVIHVYEVTPPKL
jgi:hypothetical protein